MIYNEVIDVLRSITHLYNTRLREAKAAIGEIDMATLEMDEQKTSLTMDKSLIIEAWARYRPSSKDNSPTNKASQLNKRDIKVIYGEHFVSKLMAGIKQKMYLTKEEKLNGAGDEAADSLLKKRLNQLIIGN